jgi:hypothetical protein
MDDMLARYLVQFVTIGGSAMGLSEWATLPIGRTSPDPNKGNRKRYNALLYSFLLGIVGWRAGFLALPGEGWEASLAGIALMSVATVVGSYGVVWASKKLTAPNVSDGGGDS